MTVPTTQGTHTRPAVRGSLTPIVTPFADGDVDETTFRALMAEAMFAGDIEIARSIHYRPLAVNEAICFATNPIPLKAMLAIRGLARPDVRSPLAAATPELNARLEAILAATAHN